MRKIQKNDKSVQSNFGLAQMFWPNGKWCKLMKFSFAFLSFSCRISFQLELVNQFIVLNEFYSKKN